MERWRGTLYIKGVTVRFGFDVLELRKLKQIVKNKATGTSHGMFIYVSQLVVVIEGHNGDVVYTHQRGAFDVARFDNLGNAKALTRGTSDRTGSTSFCIYVSTIIVVCHQVVNGNDNCFVIISYLTL